MAARDCEMEASMHRTRGSLSQFVCQWEYWLGTQCFLPQSLRPVPGRKPSARWAVARQTRSFSQRRALLERR